MVSGMSSTTRLKHTHRCTQTSINLENSKLVQVLVVELSRKFVVRDDLVCGWGFDEVPVAGGEISVLIADFVGSGLTGLHSSIFRPDIG